MKISCVKLFFLLTVSGLLCGAPLHAVTPEPVIGDYTNYPIFQINATTPNILVMLDNSGSMNFNAYGSWPGGGGTVPEPYPCTQETSGIVDVQVSSGYDDAEEYTSGNCGGNPYGNIHRNSPDLDLGLETISGWTCYEIVGIRFRDVQVPQGRTITSAELTFTAYGSSAAAVPGAVLTIHGEDHDDPGYYSTSRYAISGRDYLDTTVDWEVPQWSSGSEYSVDITTIVQELVDRDGWEEGNNMAFMVTSDDGSDARRTAYTYDASSSRAVKLHIEYEVTGQDVCPQFYGYFDPGSYDAGGDLVPTMYTYDGSKFVRDPNGDWDGNWLNWATMRRIDVLRKVLVGGEATSRAGNGTTTVTGENPAQSSRHFKRCVDDAGPFTPYSGAKCFGLDDGYLYVDTDGDNNPFDYSSGAVRFKLEVQKTSTDEPGDFHEGNVAGVLQKIGDKARWGNEWFYSGTGTGYNGGYIDNHIGENLATIVGDVEDKGCDTWTPLAESFYVAMQYYKQEAADTGLGFNSNAVGTINDTNDPFHDGTDYVPCAKGFVILLTDGASTKDGQIPGNLQDYDGDGDSTGCVEGSGSNCDLADGGSTYLDDIALYAHITDLRSDSVGKNALDGVQNLTLYTIYAFGDEQEARDLLKDAAKNGGFIDRNDNDEPDLDEEWDKNADEVPDTYFEAQDGYKLEKQLLAAINDILQRSASGTAVSVLATKGEGEGTLVQAFFKPIVVKGLEEIKWVGYLQSLWVDAYGNTREDTNGNHKLDLGEDNIIKFFLDQDSGETKVSVYGVSEDNPYPDTEDNATEIINLEEINAIFEAGSMLADRAADERTIYSFTGDNNSVFTDFTTANYTEFQDFFGVEDNATWGYLGEGFENRVKNIIRYVRGVEDNSTEYEGAPVLRPRMMDNKMWKLGDIVYSTPVSISKPVENYGLLYDDETYRAFFEKYRNRETVVYVGANDGMLHAFTSGVYDEENQMFVPQGGLDIGDELWAYVPHCLLPHLKWLPYEDYTHVPFVDLKPKVIDAKIFTDGDTSDNATHPGGWGTVLIAGLNYGGKQIATDNNTFTPSYTAIDITDPRNPSLMWEKTFANLGLTTNQPTVVKVGDEWFLALSSGPTDYTNEGKSFSSSQAGHIYIVGLKTGEMLKDFTVDDANSYMNTPVAYDHLLNYNVDGIYTAANFGTEARLYKITVPQDNSTEFDSLSASYDDNPANWTMSKFFYSPKPITAPVTLSIDKRGTTWVFAGTGKYFEETDKTTTDQNYLFGIKDPFFNAFRDDTSCLHQYGTTCPEINEDGNLADHLFFSGAYTIRSASEVDVGSGGVSGIDTFASLLEEARRDIYDGWYRELCPGTIGSGTCGSSGPSERIVNKPAILGGIVLAPTFAPNQDICGFGGDGRMFAVFYETGTAYKRRVIGTAAENTDQILDTISLGEGLSSSFGIHVGKEEGGTAYGQMSTGVIEQINVIPAINPKSTPIYWREEPHLWQ